MLTLFCAMTWIFFELAYLNLTFFVRRELNSFHAFTYDLVHFCIVLGGLWSILPHHLRCYVRCNGATFESSVNILRRVILRILMVGLLSLILQ